MAVGAAAPPSPIMTALSAYMSAAAGRKLPDEVVEKAKQITGHGSRNDFWVPPPPGRFAIQFARAYRGERVATVVASNTVAGPSKRPWPMGCWRIPMKPTMRIPRRNRIPPAPSCPPRWLPESGLSMATRFLRAVDAWLRHRPAGGADDGQVAIHGRAATGAPTASREYSAQRRRPLVPAG